MYRKLVLIYVFVVVPLTSTQFAAADYTLTNGRTTGTVWVVYSVWNPAKGVWPEGWRTQGWYEIEPRETIVLPIHRNSAFVYIRVERENSEVKPIDHATRDSSPFWIHPSKPFTVVETDEGDFLRSNRVQWSLEQATLYEYRNGSSHIIVEPCLPDLPAQPTAREIKHDFSKNVEDSMRQGDKVHILGNPGERLWNWTQGTFQQAWTDCLPGDCLEIEGDAEFLCLMVEVCSLEFLRLERMKL